MSDTKQESFYTRQRDGGRKKTQKKKIRKVVDLTAYNHRLVTSKFMKVFQVRFMISHG